MIIVKNLIASLYKKVSIEQEDYDRIFDLLKHDKKNKNGQLNFVLLNDFEDFKLDCNVSNKLLEESIEFYNS